MNEYKTIAEVATLLGVAYNSVLLLRRKLGIGTRHVGMWWISPDDIEQMKENCRTYQLSHR